MPKNDIYIQVTKPSSGHSNYEGNKGGGLVTVLQNDKSSCRQDVEVDGCGNKTLGFNMGGCTCWMFPISNEQSTSSLSEHDCSLTYMVFTVTLKLL